MFFESNEVGLHKVTYVMDETPQSLSFIVSGKDDVDLVQVGTHCAEQKYLLLIIP